jgi:hypothetical protein
MMASSAPPTQPLSVTQGMFDSLQAMRPWVTFMGVMAFIGAGFMVLGGLVMMVAGSAIPGGPGPALGVVYLVMALLYIFPGLFLVRCGGALKRLFAGGGAPALEDALSNQKSLWKFMGIVTIVMLALMVIGFVVAIVVGVAAAGRFH